MATKTCLWLHITCIHKFYCEHKLDLCDNLIDLCDVCIMPVGWRLNNFKILIGEQFSFGVTQTEDIESWNECASVSGKKLLVI